MTGFDNHRVEPTLGTAVRMVMDCLFTFTVSSVRLGWWWVNTIHCRRSHTP
jgi:hypothetical protein